MTDTIDIRQALIDRLESDQRWGVRHVPIRPMQFAAPVREPTPGPSRPTAPSHGFESAPIRREQAPAPAEPAIEVLAPPRALTADERRSRGLALKVIDEQEVQGCEKCGLAQTRTKTVFGTGSPEARIVFVGEGPGHEEDISGEPFVGKAGNLLTDMIVKGMGLKREDVYICNVVKCRPPGNRTPATQEIAACKDYLLRQIEIIRPQAIVALGAAAAQTLLGKPDSIGRLRSRWHDFYTSGSSLIGEPIPLMPTYHPAYLLRDPGEKKKAWADLKMVMARLGIPIPDRK